MKKLKRITLILSVLLAWIVFVGLGFTNGYLLFSIDSSHSPQGFIEALEEQANTQFIGNISVALIENGRVVSSYHYDHQGLEVNEHSAFPVASISKWVTAVGVLKLVDNGLLDLDKPVENYLARWHLPESEFDNDGVTVRRLLSHSAGFDDDLGYGGFKEGEQIQSLEESLTSAADGYYEGAKARVGYQPGSQFMYSGAGYTLLQLLIEEVTGKAFNEYMNLEIFEPLRMINTSFLLSDSESIDLVPVYRADGSKRPMNRFTAKAAASLMTSTDDLAKFIIALNQDRELLSNASLALMKKAESFRNNYPWYGLGVRVYADESMQIRVIGHDGSGNDAINSAARYDCEEKDGIIVFSTGNPAFASDIADEWMFWQAGIADRVVMQRNLPYLAGLLVLGILFIITVFIVHARRTKPKDQVDPE